MGNYSFEKATKREISDIARLEKESLGNYEDYYDENFLTTFFYHNPDMFYVTKKDDEVRGFVILAPLTKKLHLDITLGKYSDMCTFPKNEICRDMNSIYMNLADIVVDNTKGKIAFLKAFATLYQGIINTIFQLSNGGYITASPISSEGLNLINVLGMKYIATDINGNKPIDIYISKVNEENFEMAKNKLSVRN